MDISRDKRIGPLTALLICLALLGGNAAVHADISALDSEAHYNSKPVIQRIHAGFEYHLASGLRNPESSYERNLNITSSLVEIGMTMPIIFSQGRTVIAGGLSYRGWQFFYENGDPKQFQPDALHEMRYSVSVERQPSEEHSWQMRISPGIVSDFEDIGSGDFGIDLQAMYYWQRKNGAFGLGVAYFDDFGKPLPTPLLAYTREGDTRIDILLPLHARLWRELSDYSELGLLTDVTGSRFHLGEDFLLPDRRTTFDGKAEYFLWQVEGQLLFHLGGGFALSTSAGVDLYRHFRIYDSTGFQIGSLDLNPGAYFGAELSLRH